MIPNSTAHPPLSGAVGDTQLDTPTFYLRRDNSVWVKLKYYDHKTKAWLTVERLVSRAESV